MKNKRSIVILLIMFFVVVGVTIAYFTSTLMFDNAFVASTYQTSSTEQFIGPTNWQPGEEIPKTVTTTNEGTSPIAVRVSYVEQWKNKQGEILNPQPENAVTVNLDNVRNWTKEGNYYYYNYPLEPNKTTSSFIKSVTLNNNANNSNAISCTTSSDGKSKTCEAADSIAGATYIMTITIETVQYDGYRNIWNTNVNIAPRVNPLTFIRRENEGQITTGDLVKIGNTEQFYVVSSNQDETVLLARYNLYVGYIHNTVNNSVEAIETTDSRYGKQNESAKGNTGARFSIGTEAFTAMNDFYWKDNVGEGKTYSGSYDNSNYPYVYDEHSLLYDYVNAYKELLENYAMFIEDARLLTFQEIIDLGCTESNTSCSNAPSWLNTSAYWTGSAANDYSIWFVDEGSSFGQEYTFCVDNRLFGVRPVIVVATSEMN